MKISQKKKRQVVSLLLVFFIQFVNIAIVKAEDVSSSNLDVMFVMDSSGSMRSSDPEELRVEAIKMFLDMSLNTGNKFGLIAYSDNIARAHSMGLIKAQSDKDTIKSMATGISLGEKTDTGLGLKQAVKFMDSGYKEGDRGVIVLLSDGKNDPKRSNDDSIADLNQAIQTAKDKGYTIYTIGINKDGTVDKDQLSNISKSTGGKSYITNNSKDLPKILTEIYADNTKVSVQDGGTLDANGSFQDVKMNIPNSNVIEANISMMSDNPIEVKLIDPIGKELKMPSSNAYLTVSKKYTMLKVLKPSKGDWTLKVKGVSQDKIKISYVYNYDLTVEVAISPLTIKKGGSISVDAYIGSNGLNVADKTIYNGATAKLVIHNLDDDSKKEKDLTNKGDIFKGNYKLDDNGNYEAYVKIDGKGFSRESIPVKLTVPGDSVINKTTPTNVDNVKKSSSKLVYIIVGIVMLIAMLLFIIKALKKSRKKGFGRAMLEVKDETTQEYMSPQYKVLENYNVKFSLYEILGLKEEFAETESLYFRFGEDCLIIDNKSECIIQKSGRSLEKGDKTQLFNGERVVIILNKVSKSVAFEFYAE